MSTRGRRAVLAASMVAAGIGSASLAQTGHPCDTCFEARYWRVPAVTTDQTQTSSAPAEAWPELDTSTGSLNARRLAGLESFGIALSGGGTRAATAAVGQLRGLEHNGWLSKVRYVSAVSGGAWAAIPFVYSPMPLDALLGDFQAPSALTPKDVEDTPNGALLEQVAKASLFGGGLREAFLWTTADSMDDETRWRSAIALARDQLGAAGGVEETYTRMLGRIFIDPLIEKNASKRRFSWDEGTVEVINKTNHNRLNDFVVANRDRPYLLTQGVLVSNRSEFGQPILAAVEYSPLYTGARQFRHTRFGGSYVSSWAYDAVSLDGRVPLPENSNEHRIRVRLDPARPFTLADVAASTGAAPELFLATARDVPERVRDAFRFAASLFPAFRHIAVGDNDETTFLSGTLPHADGGAVDNLAVMPLFARGVKHVLVFINTSTQLAEQNDDLKSLFMPINPPTNTGNKQSNVVFEAELWGTVVDHFIQARKGERPQVYCAKDWTVKRQPFYGVAGYTGLSICFFYNSSARAWEREPGGLPERVQKILKKKPGDPTGVNKNGLPWFRTFGTNPPFVIKLKKWQVNLLSNLTAWIVTEPNTVSYVCSAMPFLPLPPDQQTPVASPATGSCYGEPNARRKSNSSPNDVRSESGPSPRSSSTWK